MLENTVPTAHEKIFTYEATGAPQGDIETWLGDLRDICEARDPGRLVVALKEIVLDYSPSTHLLKRVIHMGARRPPSNQSLGALARAVGTTVPTPFVRSAAIDSPLDNVTVS